MNVNLPKNSRIWQALIQFIDISVLAYFLGPSCIL